MDFIKIQAQLQQDSINQLTNDSLQKIPLEVYIFKANEAFNDYKSDSLQRFLKTTATLDGIQLNALHPARIWTPTQSFGHRLYDHGLHGLRFNGNAIEEYLFISPNKAYSEIELQRGRSFTNSQASFQDNYHLDLIFASRFKHNIIWNFSFTRQNNKSIYAFAAQENTLFTTGVSYANTKKYFTSSLIFSDERHKSQDNWGIVNDTFLLDANYRVRESVPVNNITAQTRQFERALLLNLEYRLSRSSRIFQPNLSYQGLYSLFAFKYTDSGNPLDAKLYQYFYIDSFKLENYLQNKIFNQIFKLQILNNSSIQSSIQYQLDLNWMDHDSLNYSPISSSVDWLSHTQFRKSRHIKSRLSLKFLNKNLGFDGFAESNLLNTKLLESSINIFYSQIAIPYSYEYLNLNKSYFWELQYSKPFITAWGFRLNMKTKGKLNAGVDLKLSRYSNYIYLDSTAYPQSYSELSATEIQLHLNYSITKWKIQNQLHLNFYQPDPAHHKGWISDHKLYFNQNLFKKIVISEFGLNLKLYQYDYKFRFNPIIQSFYSTNLPNDLIYTLGVFMHFNVSDFRLSLYADQLDSFWNKERPSLVSNYPFYDFFFRFGITWKFIN